MTFQNDSLVVMQVLNDPAAEEHVPNPYTKLLVDFMTEDGRVETRYFGWKQAFLSSYDVLHIHWPEMLVRHRTKVGHIAKSLLVLLLIALLRARRVPIVRTVHNVRPHERGDRLEQWVLKRIEAATSLSVVMNETTPTPRGQVRVLVPHPHYRNWYDEPDPAAIIPGRLLAFGLIRAYKGIDELVRAFRGMEGSQTLVIAGRPEGPQTTEALIEAKAEDERITLDLRFVPDRELADQIAQAQVVVLPYPEVHNSGVALLALSMNRPVLMRRSATTTMLAEEFGSTWVHLFDGALTPAVLATVLLATSTAGGRVDMNLRDWTVLARRTVDAYAAAVDRSTKRGQARLRRSAR